jgi:hypothetical protein
MNFELIKKNHYLSNLINSIYYLMLILIINFLLDEDPGKEIELAQLFNQGKLGYFTMKLQLYPWNCIFNTLLLYIFYFYWSMIRYLSLSILVDHYSLFKILELCSISFSAGWRYMLSLPILFMCLHILNYSWIILFWLKGLILFFIIFKILITEKLKFANQLKEIFQFSNKLINLISYSPIIIFFILLGMIK